MTRLFTSSYISVIARNWLGTELSIESKLSILPITFRVMLRNALIVTVQTTEVVTGEQTLYALLDGILKYKWP